MQILSATFFGLALLHTFSVKGIHHLASRFQEESWQRKFFHLAGEVELVFGIWAGLLILSLLPSEGLKTTSEFLGQLSFTEPLFVFIVMAIAATSPILKFAETLLKKIARILPFRFEVSFLATVFAFGPLLGSFITEPAAMTVMSLLLRDVYFDSNRYSEKFRYLALGTLFVGISIGGVLTPFAAPPVLMVANAWNWDLNFMLNTFGWRVALAVFFNALILTLVFYRELGRMGPSSVSATLISEGVKSLKKNLLEKTPPVWLQLLHLLFLAAAVISAHNPLHLVGVFLSFFLLHKFTEKNQTPLQLKSSGLVAFFLAGLVVLAAEQKWWLEPILRSLDPIPLFIGTTLLTAVTDNATLTYLGSKIPNLQTTFQYFLVAGAIAGGGLTVIANAPNPAGYLILNPKFGEDGISPLNLFLGALLPTLVAIACLLLG